MELPLLLLTSDDRWTQAVHDWLMNLGSERTRRAYALSWRTFLAVCPIAPDLITQSDVLAFRHWLETTPSATTGQPYSLSTINLHLAALSSFYAFACQRGLRPDNPCIGIKRKPINPYGKATYLDGKQGEDVRFLAAIDRSTLQGKRDYALMLLLLTTAIRVSAAANLRLGDLRQQDKRVFMRYTNKGGAQVEVELSPVTIQAIQQYLNHRLPLTPEMPLFAATERGRQAAQHLGIELTQEQPLSARMIRKLVSKYADKAFGPGHNIHPHSLRHTAAMNAIAHSSVPEVAKLLRHKSTRVTTVYLEHLGDTSADEVIRRLDSRYRDPA
jgi:integrase/recombinase XerC